MGWWAKALENATNDAQIVNVAMDDSDGDEYIGLVLLKPDGQKSILWLLSDEEGNGPGRFQLEEFDERRVY